MRLFPGRTLDELDQMDFARLQRALDARAVERAEDKRKRLFDGEINAGDIDESEWEIILENDAIEQKLLESSTDDTED